ncbi:MAG: M15 family peptidase, partial [Acidimicrobiia bacterium]|nr:M15 family peptidase [Acidimicrobiia bacterium]
MHRLTRAVAFLLVLTACTSATTELGAEVATTRPTPTPTTVSRASSTTTVAPTTTTTTISPFARPTWLGTRPLPLRPDEHGEVLPTPAELIDRRLATPDVLPPPLDDQF